MHYWQTGLLLLVILAAGCGGGGQTESSAQPLPTIAVLNAEPTPIYTLEGAQHIAQDFLDFWQQGEFERMYGIITFASQEATPFEEFRRLYQDAYDVMTFRGISFISNTLFREQDQVVMLNYDAIFTTNILGTFTDTNRTLRGAG